jgi:hypothetical protein
MQFKSILETQVIQRHVDYALNEYTGLNRLYLLRLRDLIEFGKHDEALKLIKERLKY